MINAYLDRIGVERPALLDAAALRTLHRAHLLTVPFENLDIHLGVPIALDDAALLDKIVTRRRGGFCYELNGAFAWLLRQLGARVDLLGARVRGEQRLSPILDHLALVVHLSDGGVFLADVGFGDHSVYPLDWLDHHADQADPGGVFRLNAMPHGDTDVSRDRKSQYVLESRPRRMVDFGPTAWYQQTSPDSHFRKGPICSRLTADGRISLSGRTLIRTGAGTRTEEKLTTDGEVLTAYRDHFGVTLDRVPGLSNI